ncbi:MAG TPA: nucleoside diphosphate kinase regulator [Flavisolibacter sp.]|nr:nucleoside diphosphate kinase regulator [Flavisolibacter sp.]
MRKLQKGLVLRQDDYDILLTYLRTGAYRNMLDKQNAEELQAELKKAKLVSKEKFPADVIRLNSKVRIKDDNQEKIMELMLVTPDKADIKNKKISVMAPIGTALIGFRQGQQVAWNVPAGRKTFTIMEVINECDNA